MKNTTDDTAQASSTQPTGLSAKEGTAPPTLLDFLQNESAVATLKDAIIDVMNSVRKSHSVEWAFRIGGILLVVGAIILLSIFEKLDPTAAVILGSIAGFLFGKSPKE